MFNKKIIVMISDNGKKILLLVMVAAFLVTVVNAVIYANHNDNLLENKSIIIDPGHGGIDSGTTDYSIFFEKNINLQIALKLRKALASENATVDMTRDGDYSLESRSTADTTRHRRDLSARVDQFNSGRYELFVSIHVNSSPNSNAVGPIVLYSSKYPSTELLACCIQDRLNEYIKKEIGLSIKHNAVRSDYFILINSNIPGVIVETGFISNPKENKMLMDEENQSKLVKYIKDGIKDYFKDIKDINVDDIKDQIPQNSSPDNGNSFPPDTEYDIHMASN